MASALATIDIRATPDEIFDFLVTPAGLAAWLGTPAEVDAREGGAFHVDVAGSPIRGSYLAATRPERVVVSWGVAGSADFPAGSSRVEFLLIPLRDGTRVEVRHDGIPDLFAAGHRDGWSHFLPRLREIAEGRTPADDGDWLPLSRR